MKVFYKNIAKTLTLALALLTLIIATTACSQNKVDESSNPSSPVENKENSKSSNRVENEEISETRLNTILSKFFDTRENKENYLFDNIDVPMVQAIYKIFSDDNNKILDSEVEKFNNSNNEKEKSISIIKSANIYDFYYYNDKQISCLVNLIVAINDYLYKHSNEKDNYDYIFPKEVSQEEDVKILTDAKEKLIKRLYENEDFKNDIKSKLNEGLSPADYFYNIFYKVPVYEKALGSKTLNDKMTGSNETFEKRSQNSIDRMLNSKSNDPYMLLVGYDQCKIDCDEEILMYAAENPSKTVDDIIREKADAEKAKEYYEGENWFEKKSYVSSILSMNDLRKNQPLNLTHGEGDQIKYNTQGYTKTLFLSNDLKREASNDCNRIYYDFNNIKEKFDYMKSHQSNFKGFDFIIIGTGTEPYCSGEILKSFSSMLSPGGIMVIPFIKRDSTETSKYLKGNPALLGKEFKNIVEAFSDKNHSEDYKTIMEKMDFNTLSYYSQSAYMDKNIVLTMYKKLNQ